MDIEKAGRGTLGENWNENVTMDPWSYLEGQEKNDDIRRILGVACITDKVREARLRWYGIFNCEKRMIVSSGSWRQTWVDNGAEEDRERDGSTSSSTTWRTAAQRGGCQESSWMEKENPCGWPLTWGIHSPKEREREIRNDHHLTRKPSYWQRTVLAQVSSSLCMKSSVTGDMCTNNHTKLSTAKLT